MLSAVLWVGAGYGVVCLLVFGMQHRLIWFPGPPPAIDPGAMGWDHDELWLDAGSDRLHGWFLPVAGAETAVLVSHGNAGSIGDRLALAGTFREMGHAVLLFDYPGYGRSTGHPSEPGTYDAALAAYRHLRDRGFAPDAIVLYGESLGGAVSVELAGRVPARLVIVEASFASLPDVAARHYPWLPVRWLARVHYDSESKLPAVETPLLLLHSPEDELIAFSDAERLAMAHAGPRGLIATAGGHNDGGFTTRAAWRDAVARVIDDPENVADIAAGIAR